MQRILLTLRYVICCVFIVCNAIVASVAVWNLSLTLPAENDLIQVDYYLVFVGASGLALIFAIIFVELARRNAFTSRVWFEVAWVGLYCLMDLAGASALSAMAPRQRCHHNGQGTTGGASDSCLSARVLLAFTWICAIALLGYFTTLIVLSIIHHRNDPRIWQHCIHNFPSFNSSVVPSAPATPILPRFRGILPSIVAPKPHRPDVVPAALYSYRSGLGSQYEIEHYRPPTDSAERPVPPILAVNPRQPYTTAQTQTRTLPPVTLYPQYMQSVSQSWPQPPPQAYSSPSPPPLGNWPSTSTQPRANRERPTRITTLASATTDTPVVHEVSSLPRARPSGPRIRQNSSGNNRPPPLDLSKISAFKGKDPA